MVTVITAEPAMMGHVAVRVYPFRRPGGGGRTPRRLAATAGRRAAGPSRGYRVRGDRDDARRTPRLGGSRPANAALQALSWASDIDTEFMAAGVAKPSAAVAHRPDAASACRGVLPYRARR